MFPKTRRKRNKNLKRILREVAADIVSRNICPGHALSCAHLRARVVARAYKQGGRGMTNGPEGLVRRLIPAFPRSTTTTVPRALTKAIVSNFDPRPETYPSVPGHLLLFARNSSLPHQLKLSSPRR